MSTFAGAIYDSADQTEAELLSVDPSLRLQLFEQMVEGATVFVGIIPGGFLTIKGAALVAQCDATGIPQHIVLKACRFNSRAEAEMIRDTFGDGFPNAVMH